MTKETITPSYDAIVKDHRRAIERIAQEITNPIRAISNKYELRTKADRPKFEYTE